MNFYPVPPLTRRLDDAHRKIGKIFRDARVPNVKVVTRCPISAMTGDFQALKGLQPPLSQEEWLGVRNGETVFTVVRENRTSHVLLLVVLDPVAPESDGAGAYLERLGVAVLLWKETDSVATLAALVRHIAPKLRNTGVTLATRVFNSSEKKTGQMIQEALPLNYSKPPNWPVESPEDDEAVGTLRELWKEVVQRNRQRYWFWHNLPLRRFIRCTLPESHPLREMWRKMSADLLVTRRSDPYLPLLCVEFDGPLHSEPKKQANDKLRDDIFWHAGLPLLRLSDGHMPKSNRRGDETFLSLAVLSAIRLAVKRTEHNFEREHDPYVAETRTKRQAIIDRACRRAKDGETLRPHAPSYLEKFTTEAEQAALFELNLEENSEEQADEGFELLQLSQEASELSGRNFSFDHWETDSRGTRVCLRMNSLTTPRWYGPFVRLVGTGLEETERRVAVDAAYDALYDEFAPRGQAN